MCSAVVVGVHVHAEPEHLIETVRSVQAEGLPDTEVVLLPDGPDDALSAALAANPALAGLPQWGTADPLGAPGCFNRLAARSDAPVIVFLESGTVLGPGCLPMLVQALEVPGRGLAGPSTNRSWNEQGVFGGTSALDVARTATLAGQRFGASVRTLEPLYSLADFCVAVSRHVIDAVGGADQAYGTGPCWEMDYNIRAARAGFSGAWVCAAYAFRHPPTRRRRDSDVQQMASARRLYQDRVCGLRLQGRRADYESHCRGGACEYFAPAALLTVRKPLDGQLSGAARTAPGDSSTAPGAAVPPAPSAGPPLAVTPPALPLVTAIMPTKDRPDFALQAVQYFLAQDYRNTELIVLEDGTSSLAGRLPGDQRIRHVVTGRAQRSIGAMRNEACQLARGEIVAHWDDDDWYGPGRISRQVAAIGAGEADITALRDSIVFDLAAWRFWRLRPDLHRRLFVRDVHGGTLVYRRSVWQEKARFPDRSLAEDAAFLEQAMGRGARLRALDAAGVFIYVRHGRNAWQFACGLIGDPAGWQTIPEPDLPPQARGFYSARSAAAPRESAPAGAAVPLVSCIMPTFDRRSFVPQAVHYFLRQDYPAKELVIVDDGPEPVSDLLPADSRIRYHRLDARTVLGTKRNLACELARGSVIAHWDDDDWASSERVSVQVAALTESGADVCGAASMLYYDPASSSAWRFTWPGGQRPWAAGPSLCFSKELWRRSPFPDVTIGEDTRFVFSPAVRRVADVRGAGCVVGIIHGRNTAPKSVRGPHWDSRPVREVEDLLGDDMAFYRRLGQDAALAAGQPEAGIW